MMCIYPNMQRFQCCYDPIIEICNAPILNHPNIRNLSFLDNVSLVAWLYDRSIKKLQFSEFGLLESQSV